MTISDSSPKTDDNDVILAQLEPKPSLIAQEVDLLDNRIWIKDSDLAYRICSILDTKEDKVVVGFRDEQGFYEKKTVPKNETQNTSLSHLCSDMCNLTELNEASVLHTIRRRYDEKLIHTYSGLFCVVVNPWTRMPLLYSPEMINYYFEQSKIQQIMPPHIYSVAQTAYDGILSSGSNQSILITGESGAGKTENTKKIIEYLICASDPNYLQNRKAARSIDSAVINSGIALEAFSNAKTIHNNNSSRLGKFIKIDFDHQGHLLSAKIECYLLEKSRVVSQNKGDRNFHIFYQMLSQAFPDSLRSSLGLNKDACMYRTLNQGGECHDTGIDDVSCGKETDAALNELGFSVVEKRWIFEMIAICILIGEIRFAERSGMDYSYVESMTEVDQVTKLLNIKSNKLVDAMTQPTIKVGENLIRKNQNLKKTLYSVAGLQKVIYEKLFTWIVSKCNEAIDTRQNVEESVYSNFIGVLDMAGFEIMVKNSFEQFCINYTNEKLQQFFNHFMFVKEQIEYVSEDIEWNQVDYADDLQQTIDLVEKPMGLLSYLQEECIVPNGSDNALLEKMVQHLSSSGVFQKAKQSTKNTVMSHFVINHYAGFVNYNIDGWIEKNKDVVDQCVLELLSSSSHPLIAKLFLLVKNESSARVRRGSMTAATVTYIYKEQLSNLLQTLNATTAHFIRCIVPNYERLPFQINGPLVLHQLKCNGVLEGIRICKRGYPNRLKFDEFIHRYKLLAGKEFLRIKTESERGSVCVLCDLLEIDEDSFQIGKTKIFCRVGLISELEGRRKEHINAMLSGIQATIRWYNEQLNLDSKYEEYDSLLTVQHNTRMYIRLANWPWFRLWSSVRQVIPMAREKEKIVELETKNQELLIDFERLKEEKEELIEHREEIQEEIEEMKKEKLEIEKKAVHLQAEVKRNEDLLELMEKRFDEQHQKIMKLHSLQKENEHNLESLESEKQAMMTQITTLKEKYQNERTLRENLEEGLEDAKIRKEQAETAAEQATQETERLRAAVADAENNAKSWQERSQRQSDTVSELQRSVTELNDKVNGFDTVLYKERSAKRKCESEIDTLEEKIVHLAEDLEKSNIKKDTLKEQMRLKDNQIRKLEKKLEEKTDEMDTCIAELKKMHKVTLTELQQQNDEYKKRCKKLESENQQQKIRIDDRESSVEADSRPGSRLNYSTTLGSRQYSSNSLYSSALSLSMTSSSIRTLGGCRSTTDYGSGTGARSPYDLTKDSSFMRSPSYSKMSRSVTQNEDYGSLMRSPSTSQMQANERKIQELERKLQTSNTDYQLLKREIDVYKTQLQELEHDKEQLSKQLRNVNDNLADTGKQLKEEERRSQTFEMSISKLNKDVEIWKERHEEAINESKNDILAERKKHQDKVSNLMHEFEMKMQHALSKCQAENKLHTDLIEAQAQLDRALAQVQQLEKMSKSQFNIGETWEQQYRNVVLEMEELRDENAVLKTKIRRQYKQIELLTQQSDLDHIVHELEDKVGKFQGRLECSMHESITD